MIRARVAQSALHVSTEGQGSTAARLQRQFDFAHTTCWSCAEDERWPSMNYFPHFLSSPEAASGLYFHKTDFYPAPPREPVVPCCVLRGRALIALRWAGRAGAGGPVSMLHPENSLRGSCAPTVARPPPCTHPGPVMGPGALDGTQNRRASFRAGCRRKEPGARTEQGELRVQPAASQGRTSPAGCLIDALGGPLENARPSIVIFKQLKRRVNETHGLSRNSAVV